MIGKEALERLLREYKGAAHVRLEGIRKVLVCFFKKRLFRRVFYAVYGHVQLQIFEALMVLDILEYFLEGCFRGIGRERFENSIGARLADSGDDVIECLGAARKESDSEIAMRRMRKDACNSCTLGCRL